MDADLSHNPRILPTLINYIQKYDMVIGSRYIKGGGIVNWPITKKLLNRGGNFFAKIIVGLRG